MSETRPFVEDGSQYGVSRTRFRRMRKREKRDLMVQWFREHFDHPDNAGTPWWDGEHHWIWGGPYDAAEELHAKFADVASEKLIEEVVKEVESEGTTEWGRLGIKDGEEEEGEEAARELKGGVSVEVPEQVLAPVAVEERNGKIALVPHRDSLLRVADQDFNSWREPIMGHIHELLVTDFREGTNHTRVRDRLVAVYKYLSDDIPEIKER
jgi:hypothetical protein